MKYYIYLIPLLFAAVGVQGQVELRFTITQNDPLTAEAGPDISARESEITQLGGNPTARGGTAPYLYQWSPATSLEDPASAAPLARPAASTTYFVTVTDALGCMATDSVRVTVEAGDGFVINGCTITPADWPADAASIVDAKAILNVPPSNAPTFTVGLLTGQRTDGRPGIWEIRNDCSIHPLRYNFGVNSSELAIGYQSKTPYELGWRYVVNGLNEDATRVIGTAINDEGIRSGQLACSASEGDLIVDPGTSIPVEWTVAILHTSPPSRPLPSWLRYIQEIIYGKDRVRDGYFSTALTLMLYDCELEFHRCNRRYYATGCSHPPAVGASIPPAAATIAAVPIQLQLAPNPTTGWVKVRAVSPLSAARLSVINETGQIVRTHTAETFFDADIDLQDQPAGLYLIRMESAEGSQTYKLIKQ